MTGKKPDPAALRKKVARLESELSRARSELTETNLAGVPKKCPECGADVMGPDCEITKKGESAVFWCSRAMEGCRWEMCFLDGEEV